MLNRWANRTQDADAPCDNLLSSADLTLDHHSGIVVLSKCCMVHRFSMSASAYECAALLLDTVPGLMRTIASAMRQRYSDDDDMPTLVQLRMLAMLAARPWSLSELAAAQQVTPSSMSRTVDVLVQREWVARTTAPDDRRKVVLHLTPAGHAAHTAMVHAARDVAAALIAQLDAHDRTRLYDGLSALRALLNTSCPLPVGSVSGEVS